MAEVVVWTPGALKQPGDLVRATNSGVVSQTPLENGNFDLGDDGWTQTSIPGTGSWTIDTDAPVFNGTFSGKAGVSSNPNGTILIIENDEVLECVPGQIVVARAFVFGPTSVGDASRLQFRIQWYTAAMSPLAPTNLPLDPTDLFGEPRVNTSGLVQYACREIWLPLELEGIAPAGAAFFQIEFLFSWGDMPFVVDGVSVDYANVEEANTLLFRAVQAAAGFTGNNEPDWPDTIGQQVVDNDVTWEAVSGTSVTWQASRILVTGSSEPVWPELAGGAVPDNTISWVLDSRRVADERVPSDSEIVLLAASKIYAGDGDIVRYSATVNPLDWTTEFDAGYIPFGLNAYGGQPVAAMGLYRGNIAAFNAQGCQIWQADPDPAAITILDSIPIPCTYPKSLAPVGDDLAFLTNLGIRSLGVAGASVNLSGGYFEQVDPLVVKAIAEALAEGWTPRGLYWPAHGQYWLFFGAQAFVLTIKGPKREQRSWARYTYPSVIDAWTILGTDLYLRSGELVWRVDADALYDDMHLADSEFVDFQDGSLYGVNAYAAAATSITVTTHSHPNGTPVYLFGNSAIAFGALTVSGTKNLTTLRASSRITAAAGDVVIVKFAAEGPITVVDGNEVGSEEIELATPLEAFVARGTVLRITRSGGTDYNFIAEDLEPGATIIPLARELEHVITNIRVYPAGTMLLNANDNMIAYVPFVLAEAVANSRTLELETALPCDVEDLPAIYSEFQVTAVAGGQGTTTLDLDDATDFATTGGTTPESGFYFRPVLVAPFVEMMVGEDIEGVVQWPFLDMGALATEKELTGFDLSIDGACTVSFGWNQKNEEYAAGSTWTEPFQINGDTMPGSETIPFSVSGNSFSMRLVFEPGQRWRWYSAAMWMKEVDA